MYQGYLVRSVCDYVIFSLGIRVSASLSAQSTGQHCTVRRRHNKGSPPLVLNTLLAKRTPKISNDVVKEALGRMKMALVDAQSNLTIAQQRMKRAVDKKRQTE